MFELSNHDEVVEKLTELLITFDKECHQYETDVYLCFNKDTNTAALDAALDTFAHVNGRVRRSDDQFIVYSDRSHYDELIWGDFYCNSEDFAWGLDMSVEDFDKEVLDFFELNGDKRTACKIDFYCRYAYILSRNDYKVKLIAAYEKYIDERRTEYVKQAEEIVEEWEQNYELELDCERRKDEHNDKPL